MLRPARGSARAGGRRPRPDARSQARREVAREQVARHASIAWRRSRKRRSAASSGSLRPLTSQAGSSLGLRPRPAARTTRPRSSARAARARRGACREIAEPLVAAGGEDRDGADEVHAREDVDEPHQVAQRARPERHRGAVVADDPQAAPALAGRAAAGRATRTPPGRRTAARRRSTPVTANTGDSRRRRRRRAATITATKTSICSTCRRAARRSASRRPRAAARARRPPGSRSAASPVRRCSCTKPRPPARSRSAQNGAWPRTCGSGAGAGATPSSMHPDAFAAARGPAWEELAGLTAAARGRAWRLPAADVLRLGARYREAAADLAYARRRFGDDPVTRRLETLVLRARPLVYGAPARRGSLAPTSRTATGERWPSGRSP